jgi:enamine deaminase RidA (YjgF/YER057c/UK114 family)
MSERTNYPGTSPYEPVIGFSRAVRVGRHVMVSGTGPVGADELGAAEQTDQCLTIIAGILKTAGTSFEHVVRTRMFINDREDWEAVARVHGKFFSIVRPAATMVIVSGFIDPRWKVEIEVDALITDSSTD